MSTASPELNKSVEVQPTEEVVVRKFAVEDSDSPLVKALFEREAKMKDDILQLRALIRLLRRKPALEAAVKLANQ